MRITNAIAILAVLFACLTPALSAFAPAAAPVTSPWDGRVALATSPWDRPPPF